MDALGLVVTVFFVCWLVCGWHVVVEWVKSLYAHGWRYEMKKAREEAIQVWKDTFTLDDDDESKG